MQSFTFIQEKYSCKIFLLGKAPCPCIYCITEAESAEQLAAALAGQAVALVTISGASWEGELSPWPAPKAFPGGRDFGGGADDLIRVLEKELLPAAESRLGFTPTYRVAAGYSLAGLFSLYTPYRTALFQRIVCASGSLWYDHFLDFMRDNQMIQLPDKVYFSLGDKEKLTKNKRLAVVEARTVEAKELLDGHGVTTVFVKNAGGHFQEPVERLVKGINWIVME